MNLSIFAPWLLLAALNAGQPAPNFNFESAAGIPENLQSLLKTGPVVLAFFPKAFTGGCTQELTAMTQAYADFRKAGVRVLAVSGDDAETLRKFADSLQAEFTFVPDTKGELMKLFDVKMPLLTIAKRTTFLIGRNGKIFQVYSGKEALSLQELKKGVLEAVRLPHGS